MNNIKPQWVVIGVVLVGIFWLMEVSNRPDVKVNYPDQSDHRMSHHYENSNVIESTSYEMSSLPPVDPLSVNDQKSVQAETINPITASMLVANRGEFFSVQSTGLPAEEQVHKVNKNQRLSKTLIEQEQSCGFKSCYGLGAMDY